MKLTLTFLLLSNLSTFSQVVISGFIKEKGSQEAISSVSISVKNSNIGTISNNFGYFVLNIEQNSSIILVISSVGYKTEELSIVKAKTEEIKIFLETDQKLLNEVTVYAEKQKVTPNQMGLVKLSIQEIKQIPALLGEKDVIKALQLLPGVQKGTEGSTALYVRGGGSDQNLIVLDDAQVYNANHLFGFFSVFNGDAIKNLEFWKGSFPARYGGRLSSVIDMQMKEGNREKLHGEGGIGILSSRLMLEGPIKKNKSSFMISGRRSYFDALLRPFMTSNKSNLYRFYDLNAKLNFDVNKKNKIYLSGYFGDDKLSTKEKQTGLNSEITSISGLSWGNATATVRWNHLFSQKLFINTTLALTDFNFGFSDDFQKKTPINTTNTYSEINSSVRDYSLKSDLDYFYSQSHSFKTGFVFTNHQFKPRAIQTVNREINGSSEETQVFNNQEFGVYFEDIFQKGIFSYNFGLRFSGLITPSKTYTFLEPRLTASIKLPNDIFIKGSYTRNNQFIHLLTNTGTGLSTDLWVPTTDRIRPQQADQFSIGLTKNFASRNLNLTIESYRKYMRNILSYREGATFVAISGSPKPFRWEDNVTVGKGESYGIEILLQKNSGKLTGWVGYTLSWTVHQFEELNEGKRFYPKFDRRHDASIVGIYKISPKINLSATWVYGSGNRLTVPKARYFATSFLNGAGFNNSTKVDYFGSRNSFKAEDYHRLDLAIQLNKQKKKITRTWEFGLYNAYFRKNPFYYYLKVENDFQQKGQTISIEKKSLFPIVPSISYNFKF